MNNRPAVAAIHSRPVDMNTNNDLETKTCLTLYVTQYTRIIIIIIIINLYCNEFAGSISRWKFTTLKAQYTTVNYNQQLL
jgi:hypothetical protein